MDKLKILLLAGNTLRSKSYAQQLKTIQGIDVCGIFYGFSDTHPTTPQVNDETIKYLTNERVLITDFNISVERTFDESGWPYEYLENRDVNCEEVLTAIYNKDVDIVIFSGYGGQILKSQHFLSHTRYLHMHPGHLPFERGSTTIYYSILNMRKISVTAFFMSELIDDGINICVKHYNIPEKNVNIDSFVDNCIRADCMKYAIEEIKQRRNMGNTNKDKSEEFYVIHPVLKHVALLSLN